MTEKRKVDAAKAATKSMRELLLGYRALMDGACRAEALTLPQLRLLHSVAEHNGQSAAALARFCQLRPQTFQAMLTRAVREGWIVRGTSDHNHRILTARLTPKGSAVLRRGTALAEAIEERLWHGIGLSQLQTLKAILDCGVENLHAEQATQRPGPVARPAATRPPHPAP